MTPRDWKAVRESESQYIAHLDEFRSDEQTRRVYEALWQQAVRCGAVAAAYAREDLDSKIQMTRTLNSLI